MSDGFCAGVQILLKRMESNPDEFRGEYGKWSDIRNGVFAYKEQGERSPWVRGLTKAEIDAMYEKLSAIHRAVLDEYVMKNVLEEPNENESIPYQMAQGRGVMAQGRGVSKSWTDPRMAVNVPPGTMITVSGGGGGGSGNLSSAAHRAEQLGLGHLLKNTLNKIKP